MIPSQPVVKITVRQLCLCSTIAEVYGRTGFHPQPTEESRPEQDSSALPKGGYDSMASLCLNRLLARAMVPWTEDPIVEPVEGFILVTKSFPQLSLVSP